MFGKYSVNGKGKIEGVRGQLKTYGADKNRVDLYDDNGKRHQTTEERAKALIDGKITAGNTKVIIEDGEVKDKASWINVKRVKGGLFGKR